MARPTMPVNRTILTGQNVADGSIRNPKLGSNTVGLTQAATVIERNITVVSLGSTPAAGEDVVVFRSPPSGITLKAAYICPGSIQNHAVNEADTWIFSLYNRTTGRRISKNIPSLSNQTLAATAFKTIPVNGGYSTVMSGHTLSVSSSISGSPAALHYPLIQLEWTPYSHA